MIGSISTSTWRTRGSRKFTFSSKTKPSLRSTGRHIASCTTVPASTPIAYAYIWSGPSKCGFSATSTPMITKFQTSGASAGIVKWS